MGKYYEKPKIFDSMLVFQKTDVKLHLKFGSVHI